MSNLFFTGNRGIFSKTLMQQQGKQQQTAGAMTDNVKNKWKRENLVRKWLLEMG